MSIGEILQNFGAVSALLLGVIYVCGGIIVTFYLEQYKLSDFQVLRVKYFTAGFMYLIVQAINLWAAYMIAILIDNATTRSRALMLVLAGLGFVASAVLVLLASRKPKIMERRLLRFPAYTLLSFICSLFPAYIMLLSSSPSGVPAELMDTMNIMAAATIFLLGQLSMMNFFGVYVYGRTFHPVEVQISTDLETARNLGQFGFATKKGVVGPLYLIDETESTYIFGLKMENDFQALKIAKNLVKTILYKAE